MDLKLAVLLSTITKIIPIIAGALIASGVADTSQLIIGFTTITGMLVAWQKTLESTNAKNKVSEEILAQRTR